MPLTKQILNLVLLIQSYYDYCTAEHWFYGDAGHEPLDAMSRAKDYFYNIPAEEVSRIGLRKNDATFYALLDYEVTDEIKATEYAKLSNLFEFHI